MATALNPGATPIWPLSVGRYHAMIDAGILGPSDPVELLEGVIVQKMPKNPPHSFATQQTRRQLEGALPDGWHANDQEPITLETSEPEPDISVVRGGRRDFLTRHPGPDDVALVVEIADATITRDRILKKRIYAAAGIGQYWIVDLGQRRVEAYSDPRGDDYSSCTIGRPGETVEATIGGKRIAVPVDEILP